MAARSDRDGGDELDEAATTAGTRRAAPGTMSLEATEGASRVAATRPRPRWRLFVGLAALVVVADQLAKAWIVQNVDPGRPIRVVDDFVRLVITHNTGGLFGMFRDFAPLFAVASMAVIGLIVWYHSRAGGSLIVSTALGLLLGGALGNLADRLRQGYVLDFVDAGIGDLRWYTFNVADSAISCALVLLVLVALRPGLAGEPTQEGRSSRD
ncbi:MAG TPA: signal peptidase II [Candidatus Limnocylindrales bacterium]